MDEKQTVSPTRVPEKYENSRKEKVVDEQTSQSLKVKRSLYQPAATVHVQRAGSHKMDTRLFTSNNDDGFSQIYANLNGLYKDRTADLSAMDAYETFEKFVRPHGMLFPEFLHEFEELKKLVESHGIILPQTVLAYRMLKSANLSKERVKYVKDRIKELTVTAMSELLRKIMRCAPPPQIPKCQIIIPDAKNDDERKNSASRNNGDEKKKKADIASVSEKKKEDENISVNAESRRNQLMRDMAQLRLQAEVSQLEGSLEIDQPIFPPYLVAHTSVLCDALPSLKQLTQTARCIVIIPQAVIDILDFLKKSTAKAREAIRWLELEFRHGNRYIRAQKCNERLSGAGDSSLKKTNKDLWCLVEIVDCCRYLAQQSGEFSHSGVTTVLISNDPSTWDGAHFIKDMQQKGQCQDISFENINHFMNKWKVMWKSKG